MCGIAGFVSKHFTENQLRVMTNCLSHRGPDAEGYFFDAGKGIGLGHKRLSIIDLSAAANQPFYSADGRYILIFNGEVYNFKEVQAKYDIKPRTSSDTEIIIEAFAKKGPACFNDLNGMFTMAIWDTVEEELYLVRDRFGVKPLLYYEGREKFIFASELRSFFYSNIPLEINPGALQDYFFLEYIPAGQCIIKGIQKLLPGHYLRFKEGRSQLFKYYDIMDKLGRQESCPEERYLDEFESLLSSSINLRQVSDVPIGAFLSGGTDSSLICAIFQKQNRNPIRTFTIGFETPEFDETPYANQVAEHIKSDHVVFNLTEKEAGSIVPRLPHIYDEPFASQSCIPSYLVCKKARQVVTVAMSGDGGDELFMGYGYYFYYHTIRKIFRYDLKLGRHLLRLVLKNMGGKYERGARLFNPSNGNLWFHTWSEEQFMFSEKEIEKLMMRPYHHSAMQEQWDRVDKLPLHDFEKISLFDLQNYLAHNLLYKMDAASMSNSLEVRNPYLDYRLVEFAMNLPLEMKIQGKTQKYLMKKLLERYLPKELVYRKKWGFPAPIGHWLEKDFAYLIEKMLNKRRLEEQGIFNVNYIQDLINKFRAGKKFHYKRLWSLITFQMWYSTYIEKNVDQKLLVS